MITDSISVAKNIACINVIESFFSFFLTDRFHCDSRAGCVLPNLLPIPVWCTASLLPFGGTAAVLPLICGVSVVQGEAKGVVSVPFHMNLPVAVTLLVTGSRLHGAIAVHWCQVNSRSAAILVCPLPDDGQSSDCGMHWARQVEVLSLQHLRRVANQWHANVAA